jgi:hypothetical protein
MLDPIPQKVKDCLGELTPAQQVILRGYIGTLRAELKEKDGEILGLRDGEPNAHYHGDTACTADQYVYIHTYIKKTLRTTFALKLSTIMSNVNLDRGLMITEPKILFFSFSSSIQIFKNK